MYHGVAWGFGRLNHLVTNDFEYSSRGVIEISPLQLAHSLSPARAACSGCPRPRVRLHQGWRVLLDVFLTSKMCVQCSCFHSEFSYFGDRNESKARCKSLIQYYFFDWTIWLWEQFWSFMYAWTHLFILCIHWIHKKHVTLICVRVAPWPEGNLERHFWHHGKLQVISCHRGFLIIFVGLSGIDPEVDRAAFQPMRHGQSDMSLGFPLLFWYKVFYAKNCSTRN